MAEQQLSPLSARARPETEIGWTRRDYRRVLEWIA
jgi:hypothetical protein